MKNRKLFLVGATMFSVLALTSCKFKFTYRMEPYPFDDVLPDEDDDGGNYSIKIWCDTSIVDLTKSQVAAFETLNNGKYVLDFKVEPQSEGDAATAMLTDVEQGADIFCFAQDQLSRLKIAGALSDITSTMADGVRGDNEEEAVKAACIDNELYAFPMTNDNGYYLYYDKSIISDEDAKDVNKIAERCKAKSKTFNYEVFSNGFYSASYFMATGCFSSWTIDPATGNFIDYNDTYGEFGMPALKALRDLRKWGVVANNQLTNRLGDTCAAAVSGIWNYEAAKSALGNNLGCAEMPSFTADGQTYHVSSFSGYKLIGVKRQTDSRKASVCKKIARYLTNQQCQTERFNTVGWGPCNILAGANQDILDHPGLKALREQKPYSKDQVICPGGWWSNVSTLATSVTAESTDEQLASYLAIYNTNLEGLKED